MLRMERGLSSHELAILSAICRADLLKDPLFYSGTLKHIVPDGGRILRSGQLRAALQRMVNEGYLVVEEERPEEADHQGPLRHYYRSTALGRLLWRDWLTNLLGAKSRDWPQVQELLRQVAH